MVCTVKHVLPVREQADTVPQGTYIMLQFYAPAFPHLTLNLVYFAILAKAKEIYMLGLAVLICFVCAFLSLHLITPLIDFCVSITPSALSHPSKCLS